MSIYQPGAFIGREDEQRRILELLEEPQCRLLTLMGPGGIGKTRLAQQVLEQVAGAFPDGAFFVPLQPVSTTERFLSALAQALNLPLSGQSAPEEQLFHYLQDKETLLVLDNFEQLLDVAELLSGLLQAAPGVQLLVTSREGLNLQEEWQYRLSGLPVPPDAQTDELEKYAAVQLFVARARRVRPDFDLHRERAGVVRICRLVEGSPLAIELAATWLKTLRCAGIAAEIQRSLDFLATDLRNVPGRHRSMRAVFRQTWQLLSAEERDVFRRLSVFRGGFDRAAAAALAGATLPLLSGLVDKSLVVRRESGRYDIHELLRQYGAQKLEADEQAARRTRETHARYYAGFLHARLADINGARQMQAAADIAAELGNVQAAWQWATETADVDAIDKSATTFFLFCQMQSRFLEGARALAEAARALEDTPAGKERDLTLANVFNHEGWLRLRVGHFARADTVLTQSRELFSRRDEPPPLSMGSDPAVPLGILYTIKGHHERAVELGEEARRSAEARDDVLNQAFAHYLLTTAKAAQGRYETAYEHGQRASSLARRAGVRWFLAYPLNEWGKVAQAMGKIDEARRHFRASYQIKEEFDDKEGMAVALRHRGEIALMQSDAVRAEALFRESLAIYGNLNDRGGLAASLRGLAQVAYERADYEQARETLARALELAAEIRFLPLLLTLFVDAARLLLQTDETSLARALLSLARDHAAADEATRARARRALERLAEDQVRRAPAQQLDLDTAISTLQTVLANTLFLPDSPPAEQQPLAEPLTERELQVLRLMAQGRTNPQIAEELVIAVGTVKWYASEIYGKLGVSNRTEAATRARELGLLA